MSDKGNSEGAEALATRFGSNLLRARLARGLSQTKLGDRAGMYRNDISLIERGKRRPRIDVLMNLADALGVEPESLLDGIFWVKATGGRFEVEREAR